METTPMYQEIARLLRSIEYCEKSGNEEWKAKHSVRLDKLMGTAPSGSGIDNGVKLLGMWGDKLRFECDFHHMDEHGYYDGWTEHTVTLKPCLLHGFELKISGRDRNDIKEYLGETLHSWLTEDCGL